MRHARQRADVACMADTDCRGKREDMRAMSDRWRIFSPHRHWMMAVCLASVFVQALALSGCEKNDIKIGLMMDLSGRSSELGISARNGAFLAEKEINDAGGVQGRNLRLIVKDDQGLAETATAVDEELIGEGVVLGIGHLASGPGLAGLKVFQTAGIPMLSPLMSTESLTGKKDGFFRIIASNARQGEMLAEDALNRGMPPGKAAILFETGNRTYTEEVGSNFRSVYEAGGGTIVLQDSYASGTGIEYDAIAEKLASSGADTFLLVAGGLDLGVFVQKLRLLVPDAVIYSGMWGMTADMIRNAGRHGEGVRFPSVYDPDGKTGKWLGFRSAYLKKYAVEPGVASVYAYEAVMVAAEVLREVSVPEPDAISEALLSQAPYVGLQTDIPMDPAGDSDRGYILVQVRDGRFEKVP